MSDCLVCPECPNCRGRHQKLRFDPDKHIGVVRCQECDETLFVVSLLANQSVTTVKDPFTDDLPEDVLQTLRDEGRLPPAAEEADV